MIPDAKTLKTVSEKPFVVSTIVLVGFCVYLVLYIFEMHEKIHISDQKAIQYKDERIEGMQDNLRRSEEIERASNLLIKKEAK